MTLARPAISRAATPAIDAIASGDQDPKKITVATSSFSTSTGNELLLAFVATDYLTGANTTVTAISGGGLTWQLVRRTNTQPGTSEIWRAFATAPLANVVVTATLSQQAVSSITVVSFSGVDTTGTNGSGAIGATGTGNGRAAPKATLTTTRADSLVFGVGNDYDNATGRTLGAGQTMIHQYLSALGDTYWIQRLTNSTGPAGTLVTINDTAPTADRFNLTICEILGSTGTSSDATPPTVSVTAPTSGANVNGTVDFTASAADNVGVIGVQYRVDGANVGAELTTSPYSFAWDSSTIGDGPHLVAAIARDAAGNSTVSDSVPITVNNTPNASVVGSWAPPIELGLVAVNSVLLHTGKVLMFQGQFATSGTPIILDPVTGNITQVPNNFYNLFCAGHAQMADGRILVMGGYDPPSLGAVNANIFDPITQRWSTVPNMAYRRWYPTGTTLPDGRILVTSGATSCLTCLTDVPEIYNPVTNTWSQMTSARLGVPYYPFMYVLPNGRVIDAGANEDAAATRVLDVGTGTWSDVDTNVKDGHSSAMYLPGKILKTGTAADSGTSGNAANTAYVLDMNQPTPAWRPTASMKFARAFQNSTILADGSVLVTGGGSTLDGHNTTKAVLDAELWSPTTETWTTLAKAALPRLYHSTALLLPDGRVLTAGGGNDYGATDFTQGEIFSPPYLFKGARPRITLAPDTLQYGSPFTVQTPDAAAVASVSLIRPGAVTHAFDEDQRFLSLSFTANGGSIIVQAPANANLAPPGYYMLFLINTAGVPSIASFVRFPSPSEDAVPPTAPSALSGSGSIGTATLSWSASTDNTGVALYNVYRSTAPNVQPTAANRVGQPVSTSFTNTGLPAGTYYYIVTAQDVAGNISLPSNETSVVVLADTTAPSVSMTAPAPGAMLAGTATVSATASDDVGVVGVQFLLDGAPLGTERTAQPYSMNWNTATTSNGPHRLSAIARDAAGHTAQPIAPVDVTVSNTSQTGPGLVAAFGFNEGAGVQTNDASGQGNTGTLQGATWSPNGKFGSALSFDGATSWVTVADSPSLDLTNAMTIEAWVNPAASTGWRDVVLKEIPGGLAYALYAENGASRPAAYIHSGSDKGIKGSTALPLNAWTHLAMTYDGTTMRVYINGTQAGSGAITGSAATSSNPLRIGGNSIWGEYFRGLIDEVRVYNRALTATEIQVDMNTPVQ